ncbi:hypothetical protein QTI66_34635 [Variovorax sp. J22R133]|uniref:hypothetical protein n=1 Tax=Variovorax brevis TaxID=3053503 RepID=UPI00257706C8|nr:hypothetical protein [Variovorax sp. J22R133]MDM0117259.1 hypothetical protein [Variovorax sp. J22R133]
MIHPIYMVALRHPGLFVNHAANYLALVKGEFAATGKSAAMRAGGAFLASAALLLALALTGFAVMLGVLHGSFHWILIAVPGVTWLLALLGVAIARRPVLEKQMDDVKDELQADLQVFRLVKEVQND